MSRPLSPARRARVAALLTCPLIHQLAADLTDHPRRAPTHPLALHLAYGALARLWGSANTLDADLAAPGAWADLLARYNHAARSHPTGEPAHPSAPPLTADTYRHARAHLTRPDTLEALLEAFTARSVRLAQATGLLDPHGPGSRTRPHPTRTVYGDGTIIRPLYRPGQPGRHDPDAIRHKGHDGPVWGTNLVLWAVRGTQERHRLILTVARTTSAGGEADTALAALDRLARHAGNGIQAVVYDGAFRGVHHDHIMRHHGALVLTKVHPHRRDPDTDTATWRPIILGHWTHQPPGGTCTHTLVAHNGAVHDAQLDDTGHLHLADPLARHQVRRYPRRRHGGYRFTLGVRIPCPRQPFTAWISPHPKPDDPTHRRPDQLRLIGPHEPLFGELYGLRNDAESINSLYKNSLPHRRAAARGWQRQLLDLLSWSILTNTTAWAEHAQDPLA